jgi:hypothetical protein
MSNSLTNGMMFFDILMHYAKSFLQFIQTVGLRTVLRKED